MSTLTDQILIAVWWTTGKKWFRAKSVADMLKMNVGGVGSCLNSLRKRGLLDVKEDVEREKRKDKPTRVESKRIRYYRFNREGLKRVRWLIRIAEDDKKA